ncbi:hypothetical protein ACFE04_012484 [Oxalis oulophora]
METQSISSLTFKGSVSEAILEAKTQKKLFVVYISGQDALSVNLETSTFTHAKVIQSLSKYCIFLHIPQGTPDAINFSAIYPQKSVPCITAVGYNGVQVWQSDASLSSTELSPEDLASSLEKAWLSLHIQETTATFLTAALASKQSEPFSSVTSDLASTEQGSSSSVVGQSSSIVKDAQSPKNEQSVASEIVEEKKSLENAAKKKVEELGDKISAESSTSKSVTVDNKHSYPSAEPAKKTVKSPRADPEKSGASHVSSKTDNGNLMEEKKVDHHSDVPKGGSQLIVNEKNKAEGKRAVTEDRDVDTSDDCQQVNKSSDVHLNIRLPDGGSLRETFSVTDTLRMVKNYVDKNQQSNVGSYDLAVPYPRKVFRDQELGRSLLELDLLDRQALIVVPLQGTTSSYRGGSSSFHKTNSTPESDSSDGNIGYFSVIGKVLSFFNPFSYLGNGASSSNSEQQSQSGTWQHSPNPALRNNLAGTPYSARSPDQRTSETGNNNNRKRKPTTSGFGSNIHTLKHDEEDDKRFGEGNKFWNGNSTQYGGSSDDK